MSAAAPRPFDRVRVRLSAWHHLAPTGSRTTLCGKPVLRAAQPVGLVDCQECADKARALLGRAGS